jgi:hypothetical protein
MLRRLRKADVNQGRRNSTGKFCNFPERLDSSDGIFYRVLASY